MVAQLEPADRVGDRDRPLRRRAGRQTRVERLAPERRGEDLARRDGMEVEPNEIDLAGEPGQRPGFGPVDRAAAVPDHPQCGER